MNAKIIHERYERKARGEEFYFNLSYSEADAYHSGVKLFKYRWCWMQLDQLRVRLAYVLAPRASSREKSIWPGLFLDEIRMHTAFEWSCRDHQFADRLLRACCKRVPGKSRIDFSRGYSRVTSGLTPFLDI